MINALDLDYKQLKRTRRVNGERVIELTVFPTEENKNYFDLLVEEAIVTFDSDEYVIKKVTEKSIGNTYFKQVTAIHKFYVDLINKQQYDAHNGSITFQNYMNFVFEDTPYENFEVIDSFNAREFENLGDDNRLALLQRGLDRFKAELELIGSDYKPRFRKMIGRDTDFQFRFGHNIKAISRDIDTTNLSTYIRGYGDPELNITASYTSPNVAIFGEIDAPPVNDERFKSQSALLDEMKSRLIDEPEVSITVDFVDLRAAGYPYAVPNEGDRIWLIYEPMDDLMIETRILEIVEVFDRNENVVRTEVTLSNHKKSFANTVFDNVRKQLSEIVDDDGILRYNVLDDAVKIATEALQSAQTQLEFNNGIIAREKNDPNRLVLFNSAGIGISKDGGQTFTEAITADGFVLSAGAVGRLSANHIQIGPETLWENPNLALGTDEAKTKENTGFGLLYGLNITPNDLRIGDKFVLEFDAYVFGEDLMIGIANDPIYLDYIAPPETTDTIFRRYTFEITVSNIPDGDDLFLVSENAHLVDAFEIFNLTLKRADDTVKTVPEWLDNKLLDDLRLESPLPTSITMNQDGITAYTTHDPNAYARFDHRGLYIRNGAIQIDGDFGAPVMQGFNDIGNQVKISSAGLTTYSGGLRTSLLRGSGHTFYRDGYTVGEIGTAAWVNDPNYHGLLFRLEHEADYMTWAFRQNPGDTNPITMLSWHKTSSKDDKGFNFYDHINVSSNFNLYVRTISTRGYSTGNRHLQLQNYTWDGRDSVFLRRGENGGGVIFHGTRATLKDSGNAYIEVSSDSTGNRVESIDIYERTYTSTTQMMRVTSNGVLGRSTSSRRYKLLEEEIDFGYAQKVLNINPKSWFDKNTCDNYATFLETGEEIDKEPITRIGGLIAEDVHDAGLEMFVNYDDEGRPDGISHMMWVLFLPILKEYQNEIDLLKTEINTLKGVS